jgi:uncharacterized membrane protein YgcG
MPMLGYASPARPGFGGRLREPAMANAPAKSSFIPRRLMFRLAWLLVAISLLVPAPAGSLVEGQLGISAIYLYGKALAWSSALPGSPGSLGLLQAAILSLALFSHIAFLYSWYLDDDCSLSTAWKIIVLASLAVDACVALAVPELARLPSYWIWLASIAALAVGYVAVKPGDAAQRARQKKKAAAIDRGEVPPFVWVLLGFTLFWVAVSAASRVFPPPDSLTRAIREPLAEYVNDRAGLLNAQERSNLSFALQKFEAATPNQVAVAIYPRAPADAILEEFTIDTAERVPLGRAGLDTGALLFVFAGERAARLEVGYGLEGTLTDAASHRILEEKLAPAFARGAYFDGLDATLKAVFAKVQEAYQQDRMPGTLAVMARKLHPDRPKRLQKIWQAASEAGVLARIAFAFAGAIFGLVYWRLFPQWLAFARDLRRGFANRRAGRPFADGLDRANGQEVVDSVLLLVWTLAALVPAAGVILIAGGGAFGGAGALIRW